VSGPASARLATPAEVDEHDDTLAVPRVAARLDDLIARPAAIAAQARRDAERWLDDGGSLGPEAMAEAWAVPTPKGKRVVVDPVALELTSVDKRRRSKRLP
jgi:hypothetical protein